MKQKAIIIVQARMSSSRLPGKMFMPLVGTPLFEAVIRRCMQIDQLLDSAGHSIPVVLATSDSQSDVVLVQQAKRRNLQVFAGDLEDVQQRTLQCARQHKADVIVRVCGDSPFVDLSAMKACLRRLVDEGLDYCAVDQEDCVQGLDCEVFTSEALMRSRKMDESPESKEHVTYFIRGNENDFRKSLVRPGLKCKEIPDLKLTVDTKRDYELCCRISKSLHKSSKNYNFCASDVFKAAFEAVQEEKVNDVV